MTLSESTGFAGRLRKALIEPKQREQHARNRELVFNIVLVGTTGFVLALFVLLLYSFFALGNGYAGGRLVVCGLFVLYTMTLVYLSRKLQYQLSEYLLVAMYTCLAIGSILQWGPGTPFGILLLGLVIVMASTMLSSLHALYAAVLSGAIVLVIQIGAQLGWITRDTWIPPETSLGDAFGLAVLFGLIGVVSWLFGRQMERSLSRAEKAEGELEHEKSMLEVRVARRTAQLKKVQLEEMQQLYHFAEVGQLSTALLHDLANHLTLLTLEIEDMRSKKHTEALNRSHRIVGQLDVMVNAVRDRLNGQVADRHFNIVDVVQDVVDSTLYKQKLPGLKIEWENPPHAGEWILYGDPIKCYQAISIVVGNAADAYRSKKVKKQENPVIIVGLERHPEDIIIKVTDFGVGISLKDREKIFKSNFTTKKTGMGVGLYLARQMISTQFSGKITLSPNQDKTEFIITLPVGKNAEQAGLEGHDQETDDA